MPTYVYETIPRKSGAKPKQFEIQQAMKAAPLTKHPETGEPVRRVMSGGYGFIAQRAAAPATPCGASCGCHGNN